MNAIDCTLSLERDPPREPVPTGGATGSGALVTLEHEPTPGLADSELVREAFELALQATNKVIHALAFSGSKREPVPSLVGHDLEDATCADASADRDIPTGGLFSRGTVRINLPARDATEAVCAVIRPLPPDFAVSDALWQDAVEAFYAGREREAVILARAALEVGWEMAADAVATDLASRVAAPVQPGIFAAYVAEASDARNIQDLFSKFAKSLFGFSFATDWDAAKWGRLAQFFQLRNDVAHEGRLPNRDEVWQAISLSREVLMKLAELRAQAQPAGGP